MGLTGITLPTQEIKFSGGAFAVRGLSLNDITLLVMKHKPALDGLYAQYAANGGNAEATAREIGGHVLHAAPQLVADIIALAADEATPEGVQAASKLPVDVQLNAIEAIVRMTVATEGGLKNLVAVVVRLAQQATGAVHELRQPYPIGSGESESK